MQTESYRKYRRSLNQFNIIFSKKDKELYEYFITLGVSMGQYVRSKLIEDMKKENNADKQGSDRYGD